MGSRGSFRPEGGFSTPFEFESIGAIMGVKILRFKNSSSQKLPEYSNTSDAYIVLDKYGRPKQLRVYENRRPKFDIDFWHSHHYGLTDDEYHVHEHLLIDGHYVRQLGSRALNQEEYVKWGQIIKELARLRNE